MITNYMIQGTKTAVLGCYRHSSCVAASTALFNPCRTQLLIIQIPFRDTDVLQYFYVFHIIFLCLYLYHAYKNIVCGVDVTERWPAPPTGVRHSCRSAGPHHTRTWHMQPGQVIRSHTRPQELGQGTLSMDS